MLFEKIYLNFTLVFPKNISKNFFFRNEKKQIYLNFLNFPTGIDSKRSGSD